MSKNKPKPSEAELDILQILWNEGPSTVREVHEKLSHKKSVGYTTTLKTMQRMLDKKLLKRNDKAKTHVFANV